MRGMCVGRWRKCGAKDFRTEKGEEQDKSEKLQRKWKNTCLYSTMFYTALCNANDSHFFHNTLCNSCHFWWAGLTALSLQGSFSLSLTLFKAVIFMYPVVKMAPWSFVAPQEEQEFVSLTCWYTTSPFPQSYCTFLKYQTPVGVKMVARPLF